MMMMIGTEIAKMHIVDTVHRDLTTSNVMLRASDIFHQRFTGGDAAVGAQTCICFDLHDEIGGGGLEGAIHRGNTDRGENVKRET
jgi:hypothetical protein